MKNWELKEELQKKEEEIDILTEDKHALHYQLHQANERIAELENELYNLKNK